MTWTAEEEEWLAEAWPQMRMDGLVRDHAERFGFERTAAAIRREPTRNSGVVSRYRKLTEDQVREILSDKRKAHVIAKEYGIDRKSVWSIKNRKTYKDIR